MPVIRYRTFNFNPATLELIGRCNQIITIYAAQGLTLTLRQLYYQLVSRAIIPNKVTEYKRLGSIVNDARLAGMIDWEAIEDRTRNLRSLPHWDSPEAIIESCSTQYRIYKWATQPYYVEVWIEKDALIGVIEGVCEGHDVPYFSCRGYTSQSEMWGAAQRLRDRLRTGKRCVILHLGDHDPSGIDMTRDIQDRLGLFKAPAEVRRLALLREQIDIYNPPPNPAKSTDSRYQGYSSEHGDQSWELDALEPVVLRDLITGEIEGLLDADAWAVARAKEERHRKLLGEAAARWEAEVVPLLEAE